MEQAELGFRGNPVTSNAQWTPQLEMINGIEMVLVPAGCFMMGGEEYDHQQPIHEQCFDDPFWIGRYPINSAQYAEAVTSGVCQASSYADDERLNDPLQPVVGVSWFEALAYAQWKEADLPTEAQWEYAARGPDSLKYPWGNDFDQNKLVYKANSREQTAKVGSRPGGVSWVGALDMSGNVWEWTSTHYKLYPYDPNDGRENLADREAARVLRGGAFAYDARDARAATRVRHFPYNWSPYDGFRIVLRAAPS